MTYETQTSDLPEALRPVFPAQDFHFARLAISGIDNEAVLAKNAVEQREEEINLFHQSIHSGDAYVEYLASRIEQAINQHQALPVVRFADGEYAFYDGSLKCNGLYQQAESVEAIKAALPAHLQDITYVAQHGLLATLVFPGNVRQHGGLFSMFKKKKGNDMALRFLTLLAQNKIYLSSTNYVPFYGVYAYLSSLRFANAVNGKTVLVVNSDFNKAACEDWFSRVGSHPNLVHVPISATYVATQWEKMREQVLNSISVQPDCAMVGAGVGALQVSVDIAKHCSIPAIDSGHILNMMNDMESKSAGPRLYTHKR